MKGRGGSARRRGDRGPVATARNRPAVPRRSSGLRPRACPAIHLGGDGPQATRPLPQRRSAINAYREAGNHTPNRRKAHPLCSSKTRQEKESYKTNAETIKARNSVPCFYRYCHSAVPILFHSVPAAVPRWERAGSDRSTGGTDYFIRTRFSGFRFPGASVYQSVLLTPPDWAHFAKLG